jgi:hypothetical protein
MLFVDAQNVYHGAEAYDEEYSYDPVKLRKKLINDYYEVRSYFFDSYRPGENNKDEFFMH